jgi:hypothetical protein
MKLIEVWLFNYVETMNLKMKEKLYYKEMKNTCKS